MQKLIGEVLAGQYRVDELLGEGGMAVVYKVWDIRRATYLALKLLKRDLAQDKVFIRRFHREAQTLADLQHPNIVRLYGLEQDRDLAFMLLDYINGPSLQSVIYKEQGALPFTSVLNVMRATCAALQYAHHLGFVHADVKPGNILIDDQGKVYLSDFGLAKMVESVTMTMVGWGTPAYISPEQIQGNLPTVYSDQYSLGVVLYEMVTGGERPFIGEMAPISGTLSEKICWEHLNALPKSPRQWNPNLPIEVENVILKSLSKNPEDRYPSVMEFLHGLENCLLLKPAGTTILLDEGVDEVRLSELMERQKENHAHYSALIEETNEEIIKRREETRVAVENENWSKVQQLANEIEQLENQQKINREHLERLTKVLTLQQAVNQALSEEEWEQAEEYRQDLSVIDTDGRQVAVLLQKTITQAQAEAKQKQAEIERLSQAINNAIADENFQQAESLLDQMKTLGKSGQVQAQQLQGRLEGALEEVERRKVGISSLSQAIEARMERGEWDNAEGLIAALSALGEEGQEQARIYSQEIKKGRQQTEEISGLQSLYQRALENNDLKSAIVFLTAMRAMGLFGQKRADRLEDELNITRQQSEIQQARLDAEKLQSDLNRLRTQVQDALEQDDLQGAEAGLAEMESLGEAGRVEAISLKNQLDEVRERLLKQERVLELEAASGALLANRDWESTEQLASEMESLGEFGQNKATLLRERIAEAKEQAQKEDAEITSLRAVILAALSAGNLSRAEALLDDLSAVSEAGTIEAATLAEQLNAAKAAQGKAISQPAVDETVVTPQPPVSSSATVAVGAAELQQGATQEAVSDRIFPTEQVEEPRTPVPPPPPPVAGGQRKRNRLVMLTLLLVVLLILPVATYFALDAAGIIDLGGQKDESPIVTEEKPLTVSDDDQNAIIVSPTPNQGFAKIDSGGSDLKYTLEDDASATPARIGETIPAGEHVRLITKENTATLTLSDGAIVILDADTSVYLTYIPPEKNSDDQSVLTIERGRVLVVEGEVVVFDEDGLYQAVASDSMMGVDYDPLSGDFIVDCLGPDGFCVLRGPDDQSVVLMPGQRSGFHSKQLIMPVIEADYSTWQAMGGDLVPQPSPTPSATPTMTPTNTATPTNTPTTTPTKTPVPTEKPTKPPPRPTKPPKPTKEPTEPPPPTPAP